MARSANRGAVWMLIPVTLVIAVIAVIVARGAQVERPSQIAPEAARGTSIDTPAPRLLPKSSHPTLSGDYADRLVDTDSDGQLDALEIDAGVNAAYPFTHTVRISLANLSGERVASSSHTAELQAGFVTMTVRFAGMDILSSGEDGPYVLEYVGLSTGHMIDDFDVEPHTIGDFELSDLQPRTVRLLDSYADAAVDLNGDGRFDVLRISAAVDVPDAGVYDASATLVDSVGNLMYSARITVTLSTSDDWMDIDFPALAMRSAHVDGPYHLVAIGVESDHRPLRNSTDVVHLTAPYDYTSFGPAGSPIVTIVGEEVIDIEGSNTSPLDVKYEYLRVKLAIDGLRGLPGERTNVDVSLLEDNGNPVARVERSFLIANLSQGASGHAADVDIPGGEILTAGVDGPYKVGVELWSSTRDEILDEINAVYSTAAYSATDFALPLLEVAGPTEIVAVDGDQNGRYERLEFRVPLIVGQRGEVTAQGTIVSADGQDVTKVEVGWDRLAIQAASAPGEKLELVIVVPGSTIAESGVNGPYTLRDLFMYHKNDARQYILIDEAGTSSSYVSSQFE